MILSVIQKEAEELKDILTPLCERIEIAGSIRRKKPDVKDIEIVCIPAKSGIPLHQWFLDSKIHFYRSGRKYKQFSWNGFKVDLFITDKLHWGLIYWLRTGSKDFNIKILKKLEYKNFYLEGGKLFSVNPIKEYYLQEEEDLFKILKTSFIPPEERV